MTNELVKRPLIKKIRKVFLSNWRLYVLLLPALLWLFVFRYTPMYGLTLAFKDFSIRKGILDSPWVGLKYFRQFFSTSIAWTLVKNTLILSLESLAFVFPIPIIFALFLNQLRYSKFKKIVQTISFAPYFISNVVVISIMTVILAPGNGFVNIFLQSLGCEPLMLMTKPEYFRPMYIISEIWQTMGFNALVYIAALTGVSPDLHEAAIVDGANKLQRIFYIDIPTIMPTIIIMLIMTVGNIMTVGYEKVYLMQSGMNTSVSEVISTYVYKTGLQNVQYSLSTAVGLMNSLVNFVLLIISNTVAKKVSGYGFF